MDNYTIFYSWQSDYDFSEVPIERKKADNNENETNDDYLSQKDLIKRVLERRAFWLEKSLNCNITVDVDTDNTTGMQPISDIVIKKIRNCDLFVCDVTPVTSIDRGADGRRNKSMPNSNVMFELGIAISCLKPYQIIAIAHEGDWIVSELPFDISHRKIITFNSNKDIDSKISPVLELSLKECQLLQTRWKKTIKSKFTDLLTHLPIKREREKKAKKELAALHNSEEFFQNRMAISFPGVRGLKYVDIDMLKRFFVKPISYLDISSMMLIDNFGKYPIKQFKSLKKNESFLIGNTEVKVFGYKDILVYRNQWYPKFQFILIFCERDSFVEYEPSIHNNQIKDNNCDNNEVEEYAIYFKNNKEFCITKEMYEDASIIQKGKYYSLNGRSELRRRYLQHNYLMIVPSNSIFNNTIFDRVIDIMKNSCCRDNHFKIESFEEDLNAYFETFVPAENLYNSNQIMNKSTNNNADDKEQRISINHSNGSKGLFKPRRNQRKKKGR